MKKKCFLKKTDDCDDACLPSLIMSCFCLVITAANIKFTEKERQLLLAYFFVDLLAYFFVELFALSYKLPEVPRHCLGKYLLTELLNNLSSRDLI